MKKILALMMALVLIVSVGAVAVHAEEKAEVYVTISDVNGYLPVAYEKVAVTDIDGDNKLTINDALYAAHEQFYEGGAAAGFATEVTKYGLSMTKLWGTANGYSYGYMINDASAWSMTDPVKDGDYVAAYVFTDTKTFADKYSYFDIKETELTDSYTLELTLMKNDFDADWNPITVPVEGAEIHIDRLPRERYLDEMQRKYFYTDKNGKVTIEFEHNGEYQITAVAKDQVIVSPICLAKVTSLPPTSEFVYVTIADAEGKLAVAYQPVIAKDLDGDEIVTIDEALYAAHERFYEGGAEAGYASETTKWGLSLTKLWGTANGGSYGYVVNNKPAWSLSDPIGTEDHIAAYVFTDTKTFADKYTFFADGVNKARTAGDLEYTLMKNDYDASGNLLVVPVEGAELTIDGEPTGVFTDADGKAKLYFDQDGRYLISAVAKDQVIVPPVCRLLVDLTEPTVPEEEGEKADEPTEIAPTEAETVDVTPTENKPATEDTATKDTATKDSSTPKTGDTTHLWLWILLTLVCALGACFTVVIYKKQNEKQ